MGRHPFAGGFAGGDLSLEEKIKSCRFAYGPNAVARQMTPPPHTLPLESVSPTVSSLFERAFSENATRSGARPQAVEWIAGLEQLLSTLKGCQQNPAHVHYSKLNTCPWCEIEALTQVSLFSVSSAPAAKLRTFNVVTIWNLIQGVPCPEDAYVPAFDDGKGCFPAVPPSAEFSQIRAQRVATAWTFFLVALGVGSCGLFMPSLAVFWIFIAILVLAVLWPIVASIGADEKKEAIGRFVRTRERYDEIQRKWEATASSAIFRERAAYLESARNKYVHLESYRQLKLEELRANVWNRQKMRHMDRFRIADANIEGIGDGRRATLQSYGIETAADVNYASVRNVPGFGEVLAWSLCYWAEQVEERFHYNPSRGVEESDIRQLDNEINLQKSTIENLLINGVTELRQVANRINIARSSLRDELDQAMKELAQAHADFSTLGGLQ